MKETKYRARIGLDFILNSSGEPIQKTLDSWWKFAEKQAKRKSKAENFLWEPSVYLNDNPDIHGRTFNYVTISYFHSD